MPGRAAVVPTEAGLVRAVRETFVIWLATRVAIELLGLLVVAIHGRPDHAGPGFFGIFYNWDSGWFGCITRHGYFGPGCGADQTTGRVAFFPGYPLLSRPLAWLLGGGSVTFDSTVLALWIVAAVASFVAAVFLYRLADAQHGQQLARRAVLLLLAGSYSIFLVASYSEALFLAFGIGAWYWCVRRNYLLSGLLAAAASFTRVNGIFLTTALLVMCVLAYRRAGARVRIGSLAALALGYVGAGGYLVWVGHRLHNYRAWFDVQRDTWHRSTQLPWQTLYRQLGRIAHDGRADRVIQDVLEVGFAVVVCAIVVLLIVRRDWPVAVFAGLTMISLMTSGTYQSLARNTLTIFPIFIVVALFSENRRWRLVYPVVLIIGLGLLAFNTVQLALGHWAD